jgi:hypothetical protein
MGLPTSGRLGAPHLSEREGFGKGSTFLWSLSPIGSTIDSPPSESWNLCASDSKETKLTQQDTHRFHTPVVVSTYGEYGQKVGYTALKDSGMPLSRKSPNGLAQESESTSKANN